MGCVFYFKQHHESFVMNTTRNISKKVQSTIFLKPQTLFQLISFSYFLFIINSLLVSDIFPLYRFSVFALGSKAYPKFAAFGRALDALLGELGGERIMAIGLGDELSGQDQSFKQWAQDVFKVSETDCAPI